MMKSNLLMEGAVTQDRGKSPNTVSLFDFKTNVGLMRLDFNK